MQSLQIPASHLPVLQETLSTFIPVLQLHRILQHYEMW